MVSKCNLKLTACIALFFLTAIAQLPPASAQSVLFDFENAPLYTPLPMNVTAGGITAHLSATGQGYSIQDISYVIGMYPQGFSGHGISPSSVYAADLLIGFDHTLTDFSIMCAPQELACDCSARMRVTAYMNTGYVGTNTATSNNPGTWPTDILSCSFSQGFNNVVIHYDAAPNCGCDYGVIFVADNMQVTAVLPTTLNLTAFLQGFYTGGGIMTSTLYNLSLSTDPTATDTVEVNLWSTAHLGNSSPDYSAKAILHHNGTASVTYPAVVAGNSFYIAVRHRNSLETWSANPVAFTSTTSYNFTTAMTQAYSNGYNPPMKNMGSNVYAIWGGNPMGDGPIDAADLAAVDNGAAHFLYGYNPTDCNGNGATDAADMALIDNNVQLQIFFARP